MRSKNFFDRLTVAVALFLLVALAIALPILPKKDFSVKERRALSAFPALRADSLLEGHFFTSLSTYYADHFPLREAFTALKATAERVLGKQESNGILFGKDGYLIARGEYESLAVAEQNLAACRVLADRTAPPLSIAILPRTTDVMTPYLPSGYDTTRAAQIHESIDDALPAQIDLTESLQEAVERGESVFYRTDHHWTTEGAYLAYVTLAPSLGITPYGKEYFSPVTATENFFGTSFARSGLSTTLPDTITLYRYKGDESYVVESEEIESERHSLYAWEALVGDDPYEVFLGGNYARVTVTDPTSPEKPTLLLFKDSFANALAPFLALHFQLVLVDPRYEPSGATAILEEIKPDHVLILFGADTLATTPMLARLGQ